MMYVLKVPCQVQSFHLDKGLFAMEISFVSKQGVFHYKQPASVCHFYGRP